MGNKLQQPQQQQQASENGTMPSAVVNDPLESRKMIQSMKVPEIKEALRTRQAPVSGKKADLVSRLKQLVGSDYIWVKRTQEDVDRDEAAAVSGNKNTAIDCGAVWMIQEGSLVNVPEGLDIREGATKGFLLPTNREARPSFMERKSYLLDNKIARPKFTPKPNTVRHKANKERGGPSRVFRLSWNSSPLAFFNSQLTPKFRQKCMVEPTNMRASMEGAGSGVKGSTNYSDWKPFTLADIEGFLGLLIINGLSPKPQITMWFNSSAVSRVLGNDFLRMRFPNGERRWRHFRRFLTLYDPRIHPESAKAKRPLFKVEILLQHLLKNAKRCWDTGAKVSIDEQTIGFQGRHGSKLRITYKRIGDGFQADAICEDGYTYAFKFRHDLVPSVGTEDLSPLHKRCVWLMKELQNDWTSIYLDNLYNSLKFTKVAYKEKCLVHGVVRTHQRGLPSSVIQKEEKSRKKQDNVRNTVKCAVQRNKNMTDVIACSIYDTKPVHFFSTTESCVDWVSKKRKVWYQDDNTMKDMTFLRLNFIDSYNNGMGGVDLADQLRLQYRPERWMRQPKWWWSIFLWGLGIAVTNAYVLYCKTYEREEERRARLKMKFDQKMTPKLTHFAFLEMLGLQLVWPDEYLKPETCTVSVTSSSRSSRGKRRFREGSTISSTCSIHETIKKKKSDTIKLEKLDVHFPSRKDGSFHPIVTARVGVVCQMCNHFKDKKGARKKTLLGVVKCAKCNIHLCSACFNEFHGVGNAQLITFI